MFFHSFMEMLSEESISFNPKAACWKKFTGQLPDDAIYAMHVYNADFSTKEVLSYLIEAQTQAFIKNIVHTPDPKGRLCHVIELFIISAIDKAKNSFGLPYEKITVTINSEKFYDTRWENGISSMVKGEITKQTIEGLTDRLFELGDEFHLLDDITNAAIIISVCSVHKRDAV